MFKRLLPGLRKIALVALLGAGFGFVWPYRQAFFGDDPQERERGYETIKIETERDTVTRTLIGGAIGASGMFLLLMSRKREEA